MGGGIVHFCCKRWDDLCSLSHLLVLCPLRFGGDLRRHRRHGSRPGVGELQEPHQLGKRVGILDQGGRQAGGCLHGALLGRQLQQQLGEKHSGCGITMPLVKL